MARGKCPNCKNLLSELVIDAHINGFVHPGKSYSCVNFLCPNCSTVVGSQMDPVPLKSDLLNVLERKLQTG